MKSLLTKIISVFTIFVLSVSLIACSTTADKCSNGHTWQLTSTTATCYDAGTENYTCKICKSTKTENVAAYGHDFVTVSYNAPTCKTTGLELKRCSRCNFESSTTLLQVDHDYEVKSTTPSTCTTHGSQTLECLMCHETKTDTLPLKDHDYKLINEIPSTCTVKGSQTYECKDCTDSYTNELDLLKHDYQLNNTIPSTCAVPGSKEYECSYCHDTYSDELPLEEHKFSEITVEEPAATCFTKGEIVKKCDVCGDSLKQSEIPLLVHEFGADGYCIKCGIFETLFDETKLNIRHTSATSLGWIGGELAPKFKDTGTIFDSYWKDHSVIVTVYLYDQDNELLGEKDFASQIDSNGKITIQSTQQTQLQDSRPNQISLRLQADGAFSLDILNACKSYKIKIFCDGYNPIEKTYSI
ncbi:MAG: hypothetical protein J1E81_10350 [Eubacterium sp.]|nr:hypothetical protein [Eubacterium sp.]